jgi:Ricin-type beta-trefoil lectin domain
MNNSHLHFEVLQSSVIDYNSACQYSFNSCWGAFELDKYKVIPQFDECFPSRGGLPEDEADCKLNGVNQGYPYKSQSGNYWTSINSPLTNPYTQTINPRNENYNGFNTGWTFNVDGESDADQTPLSLRDQPNASGFGVNQKWGYDPNTKQIKGLSGKCLDGGEAWTTSPNQSNTRLRLQTCHGYSNQQWEADGYGRIHNLNNRNYCIDSASGNYRGSTLYLYNCHSGYNQQWDVWKIGMTPSNFNNQTGSVSYRPSTGFKFDVVGNNSADQTRVQIWQDNGQINQKWGYDSSTEQIKGLNDKCLDAGNINDSSNRWLRISTCHGGNNQKWIFDSVDRIRSRANEFLCIDSPFGDSNGSGLYMGGCHRGANQTFNTSFYMNSKNFFKAVTLARNSNAVFDIAGGWNDANQTQINIYSRNNNWNQQFEYNPVTEELRNQRGKCVDAGAMWSSSGWDRGIRIQDCSNNSNQKWWADNLGRIHSRDTQRGDTCLNSLNGTSNNSFVYSDWCNDSGDQRWNWW